MANHNQLIKKLGTSLNEDEISCVNLIEGETILHESGVYKPVILKYVNDDLEYIIGSILTVSFASGKKAGIGNGVYYIPLGELKALPSEVGEGIMFTYYGVTRINGELVEKRRKGYFDKVAQYEAYAKAFGKGR